MLEKTEGAIFFSKNISKLAIPETIIEHKTLVHVYTTIIQVIVKCL